MAELTTMRNNALPYPVYGVAFMVTFPLLDADGDPVSPSSPDSEVSKNGDTFADCTNEATEIATSSGICYLLLTATEMTADIVTVRIQSTGAKTTVITLYPRKLCVLSTGTCQGSTGTGNIQLASGESAIDDYYSGCLCVAVIDGTTEARIINDYVGSTKTGSVSPAWNTAQPDSDDTYTIYLPEGRQVSIPAGGTVTTVTTVTNQLTGAQVATAVWTDTTAGDFTVANSIGKSIMNGVSLGTGLTVAVCSSVTALGAGAVASIWDALLSGITTASSIGKLLKDNIDAAVSSRMATYTQPTGFLGADFGAIATNASSAASSASSAASSSSTAASNTSTLLTNLSTLAGKFTGITLMAKWLGAIMGKTADTATRTEINATTAGASYNETTDSQEAIRDRGDAAWTTGGGGGGGDATEANQIEILNRIGATGVTDLHEQISDLNALTTAIQLVLEADLVVDKTTNPAAWDLVWYQRGTLIEQLRKPLKDVNGNALSSTDTIVGAIQEP